MGSDDLYPGPKSSRPADVERRAGLAKALRERYQGKLSASAGTARHWREAIAAYESLGELLGRLGSFAGLLYAANTADPEHAKFYGDIQEQITAIFVGPAVLRAGDQQD